MKKLFAIVSALTLLASAAFAGGVTYDLVSVSLVVRQGTGTNITTQVFNNRKFLDFVAATNNIPRSDLFIGLSETTGEVLVIQRSTETIRFGIIANLGAAAGVAATGTNSLRYVTFGANIASPTIIFGGFCYETQKRNRNGVLVATTRTFTGGNGNAVVSGSVKTNGRKITL